MKRFHVAIGVADLEASIRDYSSRLGCAPCVVVAGTYALWRTDALNFSIRVTDNRATGLRHLGWEDPAAHGFTTMTDVNDIVWERFTVEEQAREINDTWPEAKYVIASSNPLDSCHAKT